MSDQAAVLVSGGLDSVAALCWAYRNYRAVLAVLFDYGQPNRDQELMSAGDACSALGVRSLRICVADTLPRARGILRAVQDDDGKEDGLSPDFVTGRNLVFLTSAAAHASEFFVNGSVDVVIGANAHDAKRFPDCTARTFVKLGEGLRVGLAREVQIISPWLTKTKAEILAAVHVEDSAIVAESWSCYRSYGPCGRCAACVLRAKAFADAMVEDRCRERAMRGGDPSRST